METVGYYCDPCRLKYVQYLCQEGLPCGHDRGRAVYVYAKAYGRGGETVFLARGADYEAEGQLFGGFHVELWITSERERGRDCAHSGARELWGYTCEVHEARGAAERAGAAGEAMYVGDWLWRMRGDAAVLRAFFSRWESVKGPPLWRVLSTIPEGAEVLGRLPPGEPVQTSDDEEEE